MDKLLAAVTVLAVSTDHADVIHVAPGRYFETINFGGKAVWLHSSNGAAVTVIDAQQAGSVVTCDSGEGPETKLDGFTVVGGIGTELDCDPNCSSAGGGMYNAASNPMVTDCTFSGNTADRGGGMSNIDSSPTVTGCTFSGNTSSESSGGGMHTAGSKLTVTNCSFTGNAALKDGGGVFSFRGTLMIANPVGEQPG